MRNNLPIRNQSAAGDHLEAKKPHQQYVPLFQYIDSLSLYSSFRLPSNAKLVLLGNVMMLMFLQRNDSKHL